MNSAQELTVNGCKKVNFCAETEIDLSCDYGCVMITGSGLQVPVFCEAETVVAGKIADIRFIWEDLKDV